MTNPAYRFGDFLLDPAKRLLLRGGVAQSPPPKAFDTMAYLLAQRERAVGRDELIAAVWGKAEISDNALGQVMLQARRALDDGGTDGQRIIRTVPRFGYRWVAPVEEVAPATEPPLSSGPASSPAGITDAPAREVGAAPLAVAAPRRMGWRSLVGLAATVLLVAAGWWMGTRHAPDPDGATGVQSPAGAAVVLPVEVQAPAASGWVRLGVMDLVAGQLRAAGLAVVPSDNVVAMARGRVDAGGQLDAASLGRAFEGSRIVAPRAIRRGERWTVILEVAGSDLHVEADDADVIAAARLASARLARRMGLRDSPPIAGDEDFSGRMQQVRAALLSGDLDGARAILLGVDARDRGRAEVRQQLAELDFRAGRLDEAEAAFAALLADGSTADAPLLRAQSFNTLANIAYQRNDPAAVARWSEQALSVLERHEDPRERGRALIGRASARSAQHRYDAALADFAQARTALQAAGDRLALARVDAYQGLLEVNRDRPADALALLDAAAPRLQAFDAVVEELHARVGIVMARLALLEPAAALAQCERLDELARRVIDPRRQHYATLACIDALLANGRLADATAALRSVRDSAQPEQATLLNQSRVQLHRLAARRGLMVGDAAAAAREAVAGLALPAGFDSDGARARLLLLAWTAHDALAETGLASGFAAAAASFDRPGLPADARVHLALLRAAQARSVGNAEDAEAAFRDALAAADASRLPADLLLAARAYGAVLLEAGDTTRASALIGRVAPWATRDFDAALLQVRLHHALGQREPWQAALGQALALAGERQVPVELRTLATPARVGRALPDGSQTAH